MSTPIQMETSEAHHPAQQSQIYTSQTTIPPSNAHNYYQASFENNIYPLHANYRDFTRYLPEFDGTPKTCSLNNFLSYCDNAKEFIPAVGERLIVTLLKSKCKGIACDSLESFTITTIDEFTDILKRKFIPSKPPLTWITEMSTFSQKDKETVLSFYSRLNTHLKKTNQAIENSNLRSIEGAKIFAEDIATDQFRRGLNAAYRPHIACKRYPNLESIFKQATDIEKMLGPIDPENTQSTCLPIQPFNKSNSQNENKPGSSTFRANPSKFCNYCKKTNHTTNDCYLLAKDNSPKGATNRSNVSCNYCKKPGHSINQCRKRAYNNGRKDEAQAGKQPGNESTTPRPGVSTGPNPQGRQTQ